MEFFARLASAVDEGGFEDHVDVFEFGIEFEFSGLDIGSDGFESGFDFAQVGGGDELGFGEHLGVGEAAGDVLGPEAVIDGDGFDEGLGEFVGGGLESGLPGFGGRFGLLFHVGGNATGGFGAGQSRSER